MPEDSIDHIDFSVLNEKALSAPLVNHIYTADPSAHYFNIKNIYLSSPMILTLVRLSMTLVAILQWKTIMSFPWIILLVKPLIMVLLAR